MNKDTSLKVNRLRKKYGKQIITLFNRNKDYRLLFKSFLENSKTTLAGVFRTETKKFDPSFINKIDVLMPYLENIVNNPIKFIKDTSEVVAIENARKVTQRSITHLAQNSQLIKTVGRDGSVMPEKILNTYIEDELGTYENRFIATLIKRLATFIEIRYKYIKEHGDTNNSDFIEIENEIQIGDSTYSFSGKLKIKRPSDDEGLRDTNDQLLESLISLRRRTMYLTKSSFFKQIGAYTPVVDPIAQTNIIRLNTNYNMAYSLWVFLKSYDELGVTYRFKNKKSEFNEDYLNGLNALVLSSYLSIETLNSNMADDKNITKYKYKPRMVASRPDLDISDDRFLSGQFGNILTGKKLTPAQEKALEQKRLKKEKAAAKKLADKEKAKQKAILAKEKAKQKVLDAKAKEKQRNLEKKLLLQQKAQEAKLLKQQKAQEIAKEKARLLAEKKRLESEAQLLAKAKVKVKEEGQKISDW